MRRRGRSRRPREGLELSISVLGAILSTALVLQVVVAVLTNAYRRRNLQPLDLRLEATAPARRAEEEQLGWEARVRNKKKKKKEVRLKERTEVSVKVSLLAEELPAVPAVVASLRQREADGAAGAAVHHLVLHPVVGRRAARLLTHGPAEDSAAAVAHQDLTVVPEPARTEKMLATLI